MDSDRVSFQVCQGFRQRSVIWPPRELEWSKKSRLGKSSAIPRIEMVAETRLKDVGEVERTCILKVRKKNGFRLFYIQFCLRESNFERVFPAIVWQMNSLFSFNLDLSRWKERISIKRLQNFGQWGKVHSTFVSFLFRNELSSSFEMAETRDPACSSLAFSRFASIPSQSKDANKARILPICDQMIPFPMQIGCAKLECVLFQIQMEAPKKSEGRGKSILRLDKGLSDCISIRGIWSSFNHFFSQPLSAVPAVFHFRERHV